MKYLLVLIIILYVVIPHDYLSAKSYKGAELRTFESFLYGRFEVRYKASPGDGQTSTFFLYNDEYPNTPWNEIDVEILGRYNDDVQFNPITPGSINHESHQYVSFNPCTDFHTYAIEWTPEYVAWFIDGDERHRQTGAHIAALNIPQKIMMNIWNPVYNNWVGDWNDKLLPFFAYYDYVSYDSYTPGSGDTGSGNNFTHQWTDEFDLWDTSRWQKATHTWGGNGCDFVHENCVFLDGNMILCLTNDVNLGYVDEVPPTALWARAVENKVIVHFSEQVEKSSAETITNYLISGVAVQEVHLCDDYKTVYLTAPGIDLTNSYNLVVLGIEDDAPSPNLQMGQLIKVIMSYELTFPVKINIGGEVHGDYFADQIWNPDADYGYMDGQTSVYSAGLPIAGTDNDRPYQSDRHGLVKYNVRLINGTYNVTLMMAENYFDNAGKRVFDVYIEGVLVSDNLDIVQRVGKNTALDIQIDNVVVTDNVLDIHFCAEIDKPLINGIQIVAVDTKLNEQLHNQPDKYYLGQNYPNPFNASTSIDYTLANPATVNLTVYNALGNEIETLVNQSQRSGIHRVIWVPELSSGAYFYQLDAKSNNGLFTITKRMLLIK